MPGSGTQTPRRPEPQHRRADETPKSYAAFLAYVALCARRSVREAARQYRINTTSTGEMQSEGKNPAAVALGRLGGLKGGKARAEKLSTQKRSAIAKQGARARWGRTRA